MKQIVFCPLCQCFYWVAADRDVYQGGGEETGRYPSQAFGSF